MIFYKLISTISGTVLSLSIYKLFNRKQKKVYAYEEIEITDHDYVDLWSDD